MKTEKRSNLTAALCILITVILLFGAFGVYYVYRSRDNTQTSPQQDEQRASDDVAAPVSNAPFGYIEKTMQPEDIYRGYQILINSVFSYKEELNNNFELVNVSEKKADNLSTYNNTDIQELESKTLEMLNALADGFFTEKKQADLCVRSAYRAFSVQQAVMDEYIKEQGKDEAEKYVAVPGYSEHQSGLAVDLVARRADNTTFSFNNYEPYSWIYQNAWRYGFVLRYPEDKIDITKVSAEEWHFRYVDIPHAYYMYANNLSFEEYIDFLKTTSFEEPLFINTKYESYRVYYTSDLTFYVPSQHNYTVSGNNIDGFIITIEGIE